MFAISAIDILVTLYLDGIMCYKPDQPDWPDRDRFIHSKGYGAPALYPVLVEAGYFDAKRLMTLRETGAIGAEEHPPYGGLGAGVAQVVVGGGTEREQTRWAVRGRRGYG